MYLIETKNYAGNVSINEQGEFTVQYDYDRFGVPSALEALTLAEQEMKKIKGSSD